MVTTINDGSQYFSIMCMCAYFGCFYLCTEKVQTHSVSIRLTQNVMMKFKGLLAETYRYTYFTGTKRVGSPIWSSKNTLNIRVPYLIHTLERSRQKTFVFLKLDIPESLPFQQKPIWRTMNELSLSLYTLDCKY